MDSIATIKPTIFNGNRDIKKIDSETIFQALDAAYIVVAADYPDLTIVAQNEAHTKISFKSNAETIGQKLLDAFPDTSEEYVRTGRSPLVESIRHAIKTKKPDAMPGLRYDLKDEHGNWVVRYWAVTHHPIIEDGKTIAVYQDTKDITEEKLIEQQLNQTKNQLQQILATSLVGTWNWDFLTQKVTADRNLAEMFGISPKAAAEGLPPERFIASIHTDDRVRVEAQIEKVIKSGELFESEYRTYAANDTIRWVLARGQVEFSQDRKPETFAGTIIDITDRKVAEQELTESENRLRFMADVVPQLVWIATPDGLIEYYNRRWYNFTGTKPENSDSQNNLLHPQDQKKVEKVWQRSVKSGEPFEMEYRLRHASTDSYRWVIARAVPLRDSSKTIIKWYGTSTDIDDQKRASDQQTFLADVSKELSSTLNSRKMLTNLTKRSVPLISDWCTVDLYSEENGFEQVSVAHSDAKKIELAREYRRHNPLRIEDDAGIPRMLRTGKPEFYPSITFEMIEQSIDDVDTLAFMKQLNLCSMMIVPIKVNRKTVGAMSFVSSDSGRHFTDKDFQMAQEVGARVSLSMTNAKLYDDSVEDSKRRRELEKMLRLEKRTLESRVKERTQQLQLTNQGLRDEIIRRQAAEKELSEYSSELTRSNQELEDFAYVASHDLQEPLRKIQAFGNLLLIEHEDSLGMEGADYLKRMQLAANRMSTLIADLLTFSRVTRKKTETQPIDLNATLVDVLSDLETRIKETVATVKIAKLPTVDADPTLMRQLFQNLIGNAVKFHQKDIPPVVSVQSKQKEGGYEIRVSDNGVGFDEKYLDRIFAVFQRLNERSSYEGTGIGLAVCRKIVERYDGTITAVSSKGKGSTFIVWMPHKKGMRSGNL